MGEIEVKQKKSASKETIERKHAKRKKQKIIKTLNITNLVLAICLIFSIIGNLVLYVRQSFIYENVTAMECQIEAGNEDVASLQSQKAQLEQTIEEATTQLNDQKEQLTSSQSLLDTIKQEAVSETEHIEAEGDAKSLERINVDTVKETNTSEENDVIED